MNDDEDSQDTGTDLATYWREVKQRLEEEGDDPVSAGELGREFAHTLAEAYVFEDVEMTAIDPLLGSFARNTSDLKKATLEDQFEKFKKEMQSPSAALEGDDDEEDNPGADSNLGPIDKFLTTNLAKIKKYVPTDKSADARYVWQFRNPGIRVETTNEHLAINTFQEEIHIAAGSEHSVEGPEDIDQNWNVWVMQFIAACHQRGLVEAEFIDGQRTHAVEDLQNAIENMPATTDLRTAVQQWRPYVEDEDADVVQIPTSVVERVLSDYESVTYQDLQVELDERDYRAGNVRATQVGRGQNVRLWQLNSDWLDIEVETPNDEADDADIDEMEDVAIVERDSTGDDE